MNVHGLPKIVPFMQFSVFHGEILMIIKLDWCSQQIQRKCMHPVLDPSYYLKNKKMLLNGETHQKRNSDEK